VRVKGEPPFPPEFVREELTKGLQKPGNPFGRVRGSKACPPSTRVFRTSKRRVSFFPVLLPFPPRTPDVVRRVQEKERRECKRGKEESIKEG
jgi:hypothetical protein